MEGLLSLAAIISFCVIANQVIRVYMTAKHPQILSAWDEVEERRRERKRKMAGSALRGGLGIAKFLMKK